MSAASRGAIVCKPSVGLLGENPKQHIVDNHVLSRKGIPAVKSLPHLASCAVGLPYDSEGIVR
jgi:hypothetical protein